MTKRRKQPRSDWRKWIENLLLLMGLLGVGAWGWSTASHAVFQDWANWSFDRERLGESTTITVYLAEKGRRVDAELRDWLGISAPEPSAKKPSVPTRPVSPPSFTPRIDKNGVVGRLVIPRLHLTAMVREGDDEETLRLAAGHIPGTALPGQAGNVGIAGHRDTLFRALRKVRKGDLILFETLYGQYVYQVEATDIVNPRSVSVLNPGAYSKLTLVTCYPFYYIGSAPDRFVVKARELATSQGKPPLKVQQIESQAYETNYAQNTDSHDAPPGALVSTTEVVARPIPHARANAARRAAFDVSINHSQQLATGISLGVTATDAASHRMTGWMWLMPERRTIWLRNRAENDLVVFYGFFDGKRREMVITGVTKTSVKGYVLLPG